MNPTTPAECLLDRCEPVTTWPHPLALLGLAVVLVLEALILVTIFLFGRIDRLAAWLLAPYALWVGFASILNAAILSLN